MIRDKIFLKLLRLTPEAEGGFLLTDFPSNVKEAEQLESFRGGLNAFVHVSLPDHILVDIEESKISCNDCGKVYYKNDIIDTEYGVHIEAHTPKDGHCGDCGS